MPGLVCVRCPQSPSPLTCPDAPENLKESKGDIHSVSSIQSKSTFQATVDKISMGELLFGPFLSLTFITGLINLHINLVDIL